MNFHCKHLKCLGNVTFAVLCNWEFLITMPIYTSPTTKIMHQIRGSGTTITEFSFLHTFELVSDVLLYTMILFYYLVHTER